MNSITKVFLKICTSSSSSFDTWYLFRLIEEMRDGAYDVERSSSCEILPNFKKVPFFILRWYYCDFLEMGFDLILINHLTFDLED